MCTIQRLVSNLCTCIDSLAERCPAAAPTQADLRAQTQLCTDNKRDPMRCGMALKSRLPVGISCIIHPSPPNRTQGFLVPKGGSLLPASPFCQFDIPDDPRDIVSLYNDEGNFHHAGQH